MYAYAHTYTNTYAYGTHTYTSAGNGEDIVLQHASTLHADIHTFTYLHTFKTEIMRGFQNFACQRTYVNSFLCVLHIFFYIT